VIGCRSCGEAKPEKEFKRNADSPFVVFTYCVSCRQAMVRKKPNKSSGLSERMWADKIAADKAKKRKLTDGTAAAIKRRLKAGTENKSQIARAFGVSPNIVYSIANGTNYRDVQI
jgi:DNA invertase Pin-like site-specific DNA recombinase